MFKLLLVFAASLIATGTINICENDDVSNVQDYFKNNLETLKTEYNETFEKEWNVNSIDNVKKLYNLNDNHIGYLIDFDSGYIAYGLDYEMYKMETEGEPDFYNQENRLYYTAGTFVEKINNTFYSKDGNIVNPEVQVGNGFVTSEIVHEIDSRLDYKGFKINGSCTKIPQLKDKFDSSKWGNYKCVSFYQGETTDCGVIAIMDLLHTFRLSGSVDYTKGKNPTEMREDLRGLTNWQGNIAGEGMLPVDLMRGCNNYINQSKIALSSTGNYRDDVPEICLYFNLNIGNTAHFAMKVGSAQQDYWWIFKTYWDILVTWDKNYYADYTSLPCGIYDSHSCYYLVDQQYRQGSYQLYNGNTLIE